MGALWFPVSASVSTDLVLDFSRLTAERPCWHRQGELIGGLNVIRGCDVGFGVVGKGFVNRDRVRAAHDQRLGPCSCRKSHPGRSGGTIVFVEDAAKAVMSVDVQVGEPVGVGDRFG
jgi:hypothetical protein